MSADGSLIVGYGRTAAGSEAAIWDGASSVERVSDVLVAHGVTVPSGWMITSATGAPMHGPVVTLAGQGLNPSGESEAWVASYCVP